MFTVDMPVNDVAVRETYQSYQVYRTLINTPAYYPYGMNTMTPPSILYEYNGIPHTYTTLVTTMLDTRFRFALQSALEELAQRQVELDLKAKNVLYSRKRELYRR